MKSNRWWKLSLVLVFILGLIFGGSLVVLAEGGSLTSLNDKIEDINNPQEGVTPLKSGESTATSGMSIVGDNTVQKIVEQAGDAVVKIETVTTTSSSYFNDPFFRYFFGDDFFRSQERTTRGVGSGFIISKDGYILTNEHVIAGAKEIYVTINNFEKPLKATVVGSDHQLDLALLKVNAGRDLPTLTLGNSDDTKVGEWVIAIGNPYGLDHTVTVGVISAKGRPITIEDRQFKNLLQTDASINPGNSGGPLINMKGEVIGINTAINAQAQGIGFAIPSNMVAEVIGDLKELGGVVRPYLGVYLQEVTEEIASYLKLTKAEGALIAQVVPDSPAEEAGLQRGDVVIEFDGNAIKTPDDLIEQVKKSKVGDKKVLVIMRQGQVKYVTVTIGDDK